MGQCQPSIPGDDNDSFMNHSGSPLTVFFHRYQAAQEPMVLATIVSTLGSTYRKAGAHMLIARDGQFAGLLSGGCLESDLAAHALEVLDTGQARIIEYDTRTSDDLIWGIGLGCEGAMQILLTRLGVDNAYEPFAHVLRHRDAHLAGNFFMVIESHEPQFALGQVYLGTEHLPASMQNQLAHHVDEAARVAQTIVVDSTRLLVVPIDLPPRLLMLGAGPDALPLSGIAGLMGWHITIVDHRPAYAVASRFPCARQVTCQPAAALPTLLRSQHFDAAIVMSHHLPSDEAYLAALAESTLGYVGLLGPAQRRTRLLSDIGAHAAKLAPRLYGPVGLDIGANTPETIALAIVSEIQAVLAGRKGGSFSTTARAQQHATVAVTAS